MHNNNILASSTHSLTGNYKGIMKKIMTGKKVNDTQLFMYVTAPSINQCIANWSMSQYVPQVLLKLEHNHGFTTKYLEIVKSEECKRMTNDPGVGRPDQHWFETVWVPFIDDLRRCISETFELSKTRVWGLTQLSPTVIKENYLLRFHQQN